tara:strand:+ start:2325 stop:2534 length:210 start_codon:yes stop_codon:yes gene_type:complete
MLATSPKCSQLDFFIDDELTPAEIEVCKTICSDCPLRTLCAEYAEIARPKAGVWAGKRYRTNKSTTKDN